MHNLKDLCAKVTVSSLCFLGSVCAFAEGEATVENPLQAVAQNAEQYVTKGKEVVVDILGAGLVIVAAFFIWRLIKKGLSSAK